VNGRDYSIALQRCPFLPNEERYGPPHYGGN
jgi:hypothetical protein